MIVWHQHPLIQCAEKINDQIWKAEGAGRMKKYVLRQLDRKITPSHGLTRLLGLCKTLALFQVASHQNGQQEPGPKKTPANMFFLWAQEPELLSLNRT